MAIRKTKKSPTSTHYVNNAELYAKFKDWMGAEGFDKSKKPRPPETILLDAWKIINGYINQSKFYNIPQELLDESAPLALEFCIKYLFNFNIEKYSNPFSYITTFANNAIMECYRRDRKEKNNRMKYMTEYMASSTYIRTDGEIDSIAIGEFAQEQIKYIEEARMNYEIQKAKETAAKLENAK